ncbi:hypothetical protein [Ruegeria sp. HKCCA4707]|uniref:hypothetical protein n=1 Tax=Ruegeria sp. HKCCA4707 TaxID=2682984 RepID=UPI0014879D61|nr:hypothetical protein [Ruegeria sp. HKCCA4707]
MDWESVKPVSSFFLSWQRPDVVFANRVSYKNSITEFRFFFLGTRFAGVQFSTLITAKGLLELGLDFRMEHCDHQFGKECWQGGQHFSGLVGGCSAINETGPPEGDPIHKH